MTIQQGLFAAAAVMFGMVLVREILRGKRLRRGQQMARRLLDQPITEEQVRRITQNVMKGVDEWEREQRTKRARLQRVRWITKRDVA